MALNAATAAWIKRTLGGLVRGELPRPLRFLLPRQPVETEGTEQPPVLAESTQASQQAES